MILRSRNESDKRAKEAAYEIKKLREVKRLEIKLR